MRAYHKVYISMLLSIFMIFSPISLIPDTLTTAQAAEIKISKKTLTLEKGQSKTLKITGTKRKITWSTSNKMIASVSSKGKVTAKAIGTATITATVNSQKLTCRVTVIKPVNPYLNHAPFHAVETNLDGYSFVMPSDWNGTLTQNAENDSYLFTLSPPEAENGSKIEIMFLPTKEKTPSFSILKEEVTNRLNQKQLTKYYSTLYGDISFSVDNFTQEKFKANFSSVMKTQFTLVSDTTMEQNIYDFYLDYYFIEIKTYDYEQIGLSEMAEYVINSIQK